MRITEVPHTVNRQRRSGVTPSSMFTSSGLFYSILYFTKLDVYTLCPL